MASSITESAAKFALRFYQKLSQDKPSENLLFSPLNLSAALSLLLYGARSSTAQELEKVIREQEESIRKSRSQSPPPDGPLAPYFEPSSSPCPQQNVPEYECEKPEGNHTEFHKILAYLNKATTKYELSFANRFYGDDSIAFNQQFVFCALKLFLTQVSNVDFQNAPEEFRKIINAWVEVQTHGKIQNLLRKENITSLTQLLHVNALYFKGQWDVQFDKWRTRKSPFHVTEMTYNTVDLMHHKGQYKTGTIELCDMHVQVLEIPYKDNELSMFILLPDDWSSEGLQQLEEELTYEKVTEWVCQKQLKLEEVEVAIPKIKMEKNILTAKLLEALDVTQVLDPKMADLTGITLTEDVALSEIVHSASLEVDEEGGEEPRCQIDRHLRRRPCAQFVADHPFLFFVLHNCSGSILLLGRFVKPERRCGFH
uniref:leukocyte elastase inhibitor-like n=1 Tax=Euleptes europaea TaxID=460621 RepID=UPI00254107F4|nr:leukocyte elastase inhibitor-like [Euleptes europaea]XP_056722847.1 leukocyte elastase inhibitor-like [Euleptes europaea]